MSDNNQNTIKAFRARWVVPVSQPPIEDGVVVIENDKIIKVDSITQIDSRFVENVKDLGDAVIFPGFVNVHTHLEQHKLPGLSNDFFKAQSQIKERYQVTPENERLIQVEKNISESKIFGTISLADFSFHGLSAQHLHKNQIFARVFLEISSFPNSEMSGTLKEYLKIVHNFPLKKEVTLHLAPSAVWNVSTELLQEIAIHEKHTAIHLSTGLDEYEFTLTGRGHLRQQLLSAEQFDYGWKVPGLSPVQYFIGGNFFTRHNIFIHMNDVELDDINILKNFPAKANVCLCPRSEERLSFKHAPVKQFIENGINICLGTESKAFVEDLDMRKEIIKCINTYGVTPETAIKFATLNGAYSIGFHKEVGSLEQGKTANCLVIHPDPDEMQNPYTAIISSGKTIKWLPDIKI